MLSQSIRPSYRALSQLHLLQASAASQARQASSNSKSGSSNNQQQDSQKETVPQADFEQPQKRRKTQAELDDELRQKMAGMAGDGGDAGVEFEDGQPVSMKRSVKNNMFRYI
ncbi:hypothetical protein AUEXF2481DRAFT_29446 [Aureobasidium subglaciale EXF-2481]|uniref:Uncharacterized protein n=1 Tax=Aureobasidium subglaciale (strain EXF-2481) TaxID=1043005 RepID=A0A074YC92_AURSE|nr:uncharacterized protein AUEXF2481DRAFT_29446 [Aureobasidium subglaciale EXF-2481]KAI5204928.1 hypothetical protein E4T38_04522 [Aureobasidium subglaciale]KAI5223918.1 hypothetical protein E4T40_04298 [Aureobasidium subglaciale]KAI5227361.1 hypothetical protein E4T41_04380 [Aureobasidium subglaciale]KAI5262709.1 hypothetical protein E4T46_04266 [Aureobasidium subglaciale]KEQ95365.1 hypothetical protein AUEXF2481DRAFT_29446 [Aureobasidium subglaciale EXF-2481]